MILKKIYISILIIFLFTPLFPDIFVNGTDLNRDKNVNFIEMIIQTGDTSGVIKTFLKFGPSKNFLPKTGNITTPDGRKKLFKISLNAMRFMEKNGWKYISSYMKCQNGTKTEHFFFTRS